MLKQDPEVGRKEETHWVRKKHIGSEVTYEEAKYSLSREMTAEGINKDGKIPNYFRIGGNIAS